MNDRTPMKLALIAVLVAVAAYANADVVEPGYLHPAGVRRLLSWQGERPVRSLELRRGLDLQGGLQVLLQVHPSAAGTYTSEDLETAANIIKNRVDSLGVTEAFVQTQGEDKIVVELPGVEDPQQAVRTIGTTAQLEFIYGGDPNDPGATVPRAGDLVSTTLPVLFDELPEKYQQPRLIDLEELQGVRGADVAPEAEGDAGAPEATSSSAGVDARQTVTATEGVSTAGAVDTAGDVAASAGVTSTPSDTTAGEVTATGEVMATAALTAAGGVTATAALTATGGVTTTGEVTATEKTTRTYAVRMYPTIVTGADIRRASVGLDRLNQFAVSFSLGGDGGRRMQRFTSEHQGEVMAIALDGKVISSPVVRATIASDGQITGSFSEDEANALVVQLRSGSLPVKMEVVGQTSIGATLGQESVHLAVTGGVVGMLVVMLFMLLYYRVLGLLADAALLVYVTLSMMLFRMIPVTLTLAGIAGFVLSIGMAVDANVLIFERMKEELRSGRRMKAAMDLGFERAWPSIRDSNLSTLITCAILFWFGNQFGASIVKGFAVTLAVGVLTSVFTAITVTRTFLNVANRLLLRDMMSAVPLETPRLRSLFGF
ncbi:MAG: protein translocase subunit SecD [Anaerolineae bacterium]